MAGVHPCMKCGACCSYFRVKMHWREANDNDWCDHPVPVELVEEVDAFRRAMRGTLAKRNQRCVALSGKVGAQVGCTIYSNRPHACRAFKASFEDGDRNKRCDEARAAHGLSPLGSRDYGERGNCKDVAVLFESATS